MKLRSIHRAGMAAILALLGLAYGAIALAPEWREANLESVLRQGGTVVYLRHADRYSGPKEPFNAQSKLADFADCTHQRNLTAEGRADAVRVGDSFRQLGIPVGAVIALPLCRTRQTALLAFGRALQEPRLYDPRFVADLLGTEPAAGTNTILVGTKEQILQLAGVELQPAEAAVFRPDRHGGFTYLGELDQSDLDP